MSAGDRVIELLQLARLEKDRDAAMRDGNARLASGLARLIDHRRHQLFKLHDDANVPD